MMFDGEDTQMTPPTDAPVEETEVEEAAAPAEEAPTGENA